MKISKYQKLIKKTGQGIWINSADTQVFLATKASIYKAPGLPVVEGLDAIKAVLDISPKEAEKIFLTEKHSKGVADVMGYDLSDLQTPGEMEAKRVKIAAIQDGVIYSAVQCNDGEMVFYDQQLLSPISDKLNDKDGSDYISYVVRFKGDPKRPYIVVKDGFEVIAVLLPVQVLSDEYISDLQDFQLMCIDQLNRDKARARECARRKAQEDGVQTSLDDMKT